MSKTTHRPLKQKNVKSKQRVFETYDLETTMIDAGTPRPLYITMAQEKITVSKPLSNLKDLYDILISNFLTTDKINWRFIAHNGNNFDFVLIAKAIVKYDTIGYIVEPYMNKQNNPRGASISLKIDKKTYRWFFSDSMSMTGSTISLKKFLDAFAPDYQKKTIDVVHFDYTNKTHRDYAERDALGLWQAMKNIEDIYHTLGVELENTIGKAAIKLFMKNIPKDVLVWDCPDWITKHIKHSAIRGGYVYCKGRYHGPIWKYDINQAYADAMRIGKLPCGRCFKTNKYQKNKVGLYHVNISRLTPAIIPFYIRPENRAPVKTFGESTEGWIFNIEIDFLLEQNWNVEIIEGVYWSDTFNMKNFVDMLEYKRIHAKGGPKSAEGMTIKAFGNNAYGKTLESFDSVQLVCAKEKPVNSFHYKPEDSTYDNWFIYNEESVIQDYNKPQIGAVITATVRIKLMRAAMLAPESVLLADTDMLTFSRPIPELPINNSLYGYFKEEVSGDIYYIIAMKTYFSEAKIHSSTLNIDVPEVIHAKGLNIHKLSYEDMINWYKGVNIGQDQIQRNSFVRSLSGSDMFKKISKHAERVPLVRK